MLLPRGRSNLRRKRGYRQLQSFYAEEVCAGCHQEYDPYQGVVSNPYTEQGFLHFGFWHEKCAPPPPPPVPRRPPTYFDGTGRAWREVDGKQVEVTHEYGWEDENGRIWSDINGQVVDVTPK